MRKTVLISLDAMYDRDISTLGGDEFLAQVFAGGTVCTQVKTVFPALTYPAHVTLMTGCDPESHGIGNNMPLQPGKDADMLEWYLDASHVKRETIFDAVTKAGGRCASMLWPVTCRTKSIRWNFPEAHTVRGENQTVKMLQCGSAPWILAMEVLHGRERVSTAEPHLSDYAALLTREVIMTKQPELTAVHLIDLDDMRHHHGADSREAHEAIHRLSERVRGIYETMQRTKGYEDALLVLVSDHGQADVNRVVELTAVLKENGLENSAEIQSNGMSAYLYEKQGGMEQAVDWLRAHATMAGVSKIYTRRDLDDMHAVKEPVYAVEAAPGVIFSDMLPAAKDELATHGFGPGHPAENCLLAVMGSGIRSGGVVPSMPMRDVAPTVAELMGVRLPQAEGTSHAAAFRMGEQT